MPRHQAQDVHRADGEEDRDGRDFDSGEPEFELPNDVTEKRLVAVINTIKPSDSAQSGACNQ